MMIKCPSCGKETEQAKFCGECGNPLPTSKKKCPKCNNEWPNEQKFCGECGYNFLAETKTFQKADINLGNDNMIAGDFIGQKEDYHIAGSATFVRNEDETKKTSECAICGSIVSIIDGYTCKSCGKFVCEECFDKQSKVCTTCSSCKQIKLLREENDFLSEEHRLYLEDAYNNFMNRVSTTDNFETVKILLERNPNNEKVINAYLQMAEFVAPFEAYNFIEQFNEKVQQGESDLLCVQLSLLRLYVKVKELTEFEKGIRKIKIKWPEYKNILAYEAVYQILMAEELNETLRLERLEKVNKIIQSLNYDENDKFEKSYIFYAKCLYENTMNDIKCDWYEISEQNDLYPRIILNSLGKVTVSQNDVCDFTTISQAIENSPAGSHLWICSGEYKENIVIDKEITLEGIDDDVFIVSETENPCIRVKSNNTVFINNLKLKNKTSEYALLVEESSCGIYNSSLNDNKAGIYLKNSPDIYIGGCSFDNNTVSIMLENSIAKIEDIEVKNSTGPQITVRLGSSAIIENSKIISGAKKGVIVDNSELIIKKSEISDNAVLAVESRCNGKVILEECSATNDSYCWYHDDGIIECNDCTNFIIEDENSDKSFNKEIELSSINSNQDIEAAKIEFEKGIELLQTDGEIDYAKAFECFKKATELDETHAAAYYMLGCFYEDGVVSNQNYEQAFNCYKKAVELKEDDDYCTSLGTCYFYGYGCCEDKQKAFHLFQRASMLNHDNEDALYKVALCLYYGWGCTEDNNKAFELFTEITNKNEENYDALYYLAECHYYGYGCMQDGIKAFKLLKKVVNLNPENYNAHFLLGITYLSGEDINEDYHLAYNHLKKAADNDHVRAKYYLGLLIMDGKGCSQDTTRGMKLIRTAAHKGCEEAKEFLDNPDNLPAKTNNSTPARTNNSSNNGKNSSSGDDLLAGAAIGAGAAALLGAAAWGVGKWLFGDDKKK